MATSRDIIYLGDTYPLAYICWIRGPIRSYRNSGAFGDGVDDTAARQPVNPTSAFARVWDIQAQDFVAVGGLIDINLTVENNVARAIIPAEAFPAPNDYKVFTTIEFADGQTYTELRNVRVKDLI